MHEDVGVAGLIASRRCCPTRARGLRRRRGRDGRRARERRRRLGAGARDRRSDERRLRLGRRAARRRSTRCSARARRASRWSGSTTASARGRSPRGSRGCAPREPRRPISTVWRPRRRHAARRARSTRGRPCEALHAVPEPLGLGACRDRRQSASSATGIGALHVELTSAGGPAHADWRRLIRELRGRGRALDGVRGSLARRFRRASPTPRRESTASPDEVSLPRARRRRHAVDVCGAVALLEDSASSASSARRFRSLGASSSRPRPAAAARAGDAGAPRGAPLVGVGEAMGSS